MIMEELTNYFTKAAGSDFFAGGLALGSLGVLIACLRTSWDWIEYRVARRFCSSISIDSRSESYRHFLLWLKHSGVLKNVRQLSRINPRHARGTNGFAPAPGRYWFWYKKRLYCYSWHIDNRKRVSSRSNQDMLEILKIKAWFCPASKMLAWIEEGRALAESRDRIGPGLHIYRSDYWDYLGDIPGRGIESIVTDDDRIERVVADMRWFYGARDWYAQRGVPWRRGYLFHGPPGTGKSSLIRALASELNLDIATLDIGRAGLTDDDLREALMDAPEKALLGIEDVDAIFVKRDGKERVGVSFSGLLNAIDGVGAQEGRALIMTTNHIEKLDPALIRPGRADVHVELAFVGAKSAGQLFKRFFPGEEALCEEFCARIGDEKLAPSRLQGWLLENASDPHKAASADFLEKQKIMIAAE